MLQFTGVRKAYRGQLIMDIPEMRIAEGVYWIRGVNGSGKTTLLKMICGLIPFEGDILYNRTSAKKDPLAYRRLVGWAEAEPLFPEFLTGRELISLYCSCRKTGKEEVDELITMFMMNEYVGNPVGTYSSGMTKKLAIVLALLGRPPLVVLDEPLITLDAQSMDTLIGLIQERHHSSGTDFLLSSHQQSEEAATGDKHLLVAGRTLQFNA